MSILITGYLWILFISRIVHDVKRVDQLWTLISRDSIYSIPAEEDKLKGSHTVRRKVQALIEVVNITTVIYLTIDVRKISR